MRRPLLAALLLAAACAHPLAGQVVVVDEGDLRVELDGYLQAGVNGTSVDADDAPAGADFDEPDRLEPEVRRFRPTLRVEYGDRLRGVLTPDFADTEEPGLIAAYVEYRASRAVRVRAGQFRKPFDLLYLVTSSRFPLPERELRIRGLNELYRVQPGEPVPRRGGNRILGEEMEILTDLDYASIDPGVTVGGIVGPVYYEAGVFEGSGGGLAASGRARYRIREDGPLDVGVGVSWTEAEWSNSGVEMEGSGAAVAGHVEWGEHRRPGLGAIVEATAGENYVADEPFRGAQAVAYWFEPLAIGPVEGIEPVVRASWGDPDTERDDDAGVLLTPGVNLYASGPNRLMLSWDVFLPESDAIGTQHAARVILQLGI